MPNESEPLDEDDCEEGPVSTPKMPIEATDCWDIPLVVVVVMVVTVGALSVDGRI